jgi:hypothetical protein
MLVSNLSSLRNENAMLIPRQVGFNAQGIAVGAGFSTVVRCAHYTKIMMLPSKNVEFIDYDVRGKTEAQIRADIERMI